jgi:hypothetical protein
MHELSNLKRKVFDGGIKPVKRMLKEMTLEEKKRWMTEKWANYFQNVSQEYKSESWKVENRETSTSL